ncbi:hypothetical protein T484DRAFT_1873099 [Baffinella frigidus]|nr:hypothetical protein T484DRAFT_1873099 [Cryptophyta sp. CCMP2293]
MRVTASILVASLSISTAFAPASLPSLARVSSSRMAGVEKEWIREKEWKSGVTPGRTRPGLRRPGADPPTGTGSVVMNLNSQIMIEGWLANRRWRAGDCGWAQGSIITEHFLLVGPTVAKQVAERRNEEDAATSVACWNDAVAVAIPAA